MLPVMSSRYIEPPPYQRFAMEQLSILEYGSFVAAGPLWSLLRKGDGHPVLVVPGLAGSDRSTEQLRAVLRRRGHDVHGWRLGRNVGPHGHILDGLRRRVLELNAREGKTVSLVGWSLGGIYVRELAREEPGVVRQVITLASPYRFRTGDRGNASALYDALKPPDDPFPGHSRPEHERPELEVPTTSIYTRMGRHRALARVHRERWAEAREHRGPRHAHRPGLQRRRGHRHRGSTRLPGGPAGCPSGRRSRSGTSSRSR